MNIDDKVLQYQRTKDPGILKGILDEFNPLVKSTANKFKNVTMPGGIIEANGRILLTDAVKTFDKRKGHFASHAKNYMKGMDRIVNDTSILYIPQSRTSKLVAYEDAHQNFEDTHHRSPTHAEMADIMSLNVAEVKRLSQETGRRLLYGKEIDATIVNSVTDDTTLLEFIYNRLDDEKLKQLLKYKFGLHGSKAIDKNVEIAIMMNVSESYIRKMNDKLIGIIREYE